VDLKIIAAAPAPMNAWGYADLLAKITAGADWIIADALGMEAIQPEAWAIIQDPLRELVSDPSGVRHGRIEAVAKLMEGLLLGGFDMQLARTSRSASGAEHQFSHLWDMQHHTHQGNAPSHGFKVGIGTLAATALYEFILAQPIHKMDVAQTVENWPQENELPKIVNASFAQKDLVEIAVRECQAKWVTREQLANQLRDLQNAWPELVTRLKQQLIPFQELRSMLVEAGAPVEPEDIGITRERLRQSFFQAYCIRRRFTILDLALRLDLLDDSLKHIFGPAGPWPIKETIPQR
jgi:glycerol-1-phosphate dehydrogenase [NAD(P)+]